ncbi:amino acid adenylation domain-containing protein [Phlyctema vagabunda]|uniref:Amino acid adenylation domain-containing protein n=1 Tax=Phlyctema vagabunda TaxID=108571 RepID=A0ABR4PMD3_9HELO
MATPSSTPTAGGITVPSKAHVASHEHPEAIPQKDQPVGNESSIEEEKIHSSRASTEQGDDPTICDARSSKASSITEKGNDSDAPTKVVYSLPPEKKLSKGYRMLRHTVLTVYRRLFSIVWMANMSAFIYLQYTPNDINHRLFNIATAASANLFIAVAIRQDYIINILCELCVLVPWGTPLRIRRIIAKVYEFGGLHSGASTSCVFWLCYFTGYVTKTAADGEFKDVRVLAMAYLICMLFLSIVIFAMPFVRRRAHNAFERTHRFAGWTTNAFFWALIIVLASDIGKRKGQPTGKTLISLPSFWLILANTIHTLLPWTPKYRLRKLHTIAEPLSSRAVRLHLKADIAEFYTIRISDSPLSEWHSFACFEDRTPIQGSTNSVIVAKAGDWTTKTIMKPRDYYWTRGQPTRGVLYMSLMFRNIVVVTTGSGIGPCLNLLALNGRKRPECRVLWSTPFPEETYGSEVMETVKLADKNALIWDTKKQGRPDMLGLTWQLYMESGAEAVFVISNPKVTKMVVYGMESRGVPAFGPVFDS